LSHELLQQKAADANEYWICPKTEIEMAVIPAGSFYFGEGGGVPLQSGMFSLGRYPVTNAQWLEFVRDSQYAPPSDHPEPDSYLKHWANESSPPKSELNHPVVWISFIDALHYVQWAGLSIPSEWCWEKAARGTEGQPRPWGASSYLGTFQEYVHVAREKTASVDAYPNTRTAFGCEQMIGNVSEFCLSTEGLDEQAQLAGLCLPTPSPKHVSADDLVALRGSCFLRTDSARMICSHRRRLSAGRRNRWTGLRVAWFGDAR
jgi:serine/threonine-protein kinase